MKELQDNPSEGNLPVSGKYSLNDVKSFFYLMNAKPDTSIQLLKGKKRITISDIRDINERIQRKLQNHDLIGQIASVNLIFEKGKIQEYSTWAEFERETWHTINNKTEAISMIWDISLKLNKYENPQRHTLKVRIGQAISPKDMVELMFSTDNVTELKEKAADGVVRIDFIDQVIAGELIEKVVTWYDGLKKIPTEVGIQKFFEKNQNFIVAIIHNFTPILILALYHYYLIYYCKTSNISTNVNLLNIQLLLIAFITVFFIGSMFGKQLSRWTDNKIDKYKELSQFEITKGDENAIHEAQTNNRAITKAILFKSTLAILGATIAFFVKNLLEYLTTK